MGRKAFSGKEKKIVKKVGQRLRMLRNMIDKDQEEIAQQLGLDRASVAQWESGKNLFSISRLPFVAYAYGIHDVGEFVRLLFEPEEDDADFMWRVMTGSIVRISGLYTCDSCGEVKYLKSETRAPKCGACGETTWRRYVL